MHGIIQKQIMSGTSLIEISESAVAGNIQFLKKQFGENVLISSVVKSNAYGHGFSALCPLPKKPELTIFQFSALQKPGSLLNCQQGHKDNGNGMDG
jgi:alanine racemase